MIRRRVFSFVGLAVALGVLLTACNGTSGTDEPTVVEVSPTEAAGQEGPVPIRWFVGLGTGTADEAWAVAEAFVERFNSSQDRIEIVAERYRNMDVHGELRSQFAAGNPPDVVGPAGLRNTVDFPGVWMDLGTSLGMVDLGEIDPDFLDSWRVEGQLVGFPIGVDPSMIFYNRDLFDAAGLPYPPHQIGEPYADGAPWTIDQMKAVALQLTLDASGNDATSPDFDPRAIVQWGFHFQWASGTGLVNMFGAGYAVDDSGRAVIPDPWRAGFHWYHEGIWEEHFIPSTEDVQEMGGSAFASGQVAMVQSHMWLLPRLQSVPFEWDMAALPAYGDATTVRWNSHMIGVMNTTEHPVEAVEVAYALATDPALLAVWGDVPAIESLRDGFFADLAGLYPNADWDVVLDSLNYLSMPGHETLMPNHPEAYSRFEQLRDLISSNANVDVDQEIEKMESDLDAIFAR